MAFTGELEHIHVVDIIQLLHSSRKSGTFSVKGIRGESRITFSNGLIVGASHLNGRVRIGSVLVKMNAITHDDLKEALEVQKNAGKDRKPLIATLIERGKIEQEEAFTGLKKLIEITIVEVLGWTEGTFIVDTEAIPVSDECTYLPGKMDQVLSLDVQMVLMDALRIFDERERDRASGKDVPSDEELFSEEISDEETVGEGTGGRVLTADDLGLADLDRLENKMPQPFSVTETFDPAEIHRQKMREMLADFSAEDREAFVSFLATSPGGAGTPTGSKKRAGQALAVILFSRDQFMRYSVMTVCKNEGGLVFPADDEDEVDHIIAQSLSKKIIPVLVLDKPGLSAEGLSDEIIIGLRQKVRERYPQVACIQLAFPMDYTFTLQSVNDGIRAVLPRPSEVDRKGTFIQDMMKFLETLSSCTKGILNEQKDLLNEEDKLGRLRDAVRLLQKQNEPSDVSLSLLRFVSEMFERSITFLVRPSELIGERALGVTAERTMGPTSAEQIRIPLTKPSVFREVIEKGLFFYGESDDEVLKKHLFEVIGAPVKSTMMLLPMKSLRKIMTITYGDFGMKESSPVRIDALEILASHAGLVIENAFYRKHVNKVSQKR